MGLEHFYSNKENNHDPTATGFAARSTGCSCCSRQLKDETDVRRAVNASLDEIVKACEYFGWDAGALLRGAKKMREAQKKDLKYENTQPKKGD